MATNFLQAPGTNGFIATPFNLMSTELNALADAASAISSVGGTSGVFTQTNFASAIWAEIEFVSGGAFTPVAGGNISGWFTFSEAGSTFEKVVSGTDMPRAPDFIIPLYASAHATSDIVKASGLVKLPAYACKVFVVNHSGQGTAVPLPATGNLIKCAPVAIAY